MKTEINLVTVKQRLQMLSNPPSAPVMGRGNVRDWIPKDRFRFA